LRHRSRFRSLILFVVVAVAALFFFDGLYFGLVSCLTHAYWAFLKNSSNLCSYLRRVLKYMRCDQRDFGPFIRQARVLHKSRLILFRISDRILFLTNVPKAVNLALSIYLHFLQHKYSIPCKNHFETAMLYCIQRNVIVHKISFHKYCGIKTICWAPLFTFELRFPPGV
jgi:hypothetical protein